MQAEEPNSICICIAFYFKNIKMSRQKKWTVIKVCHKHAATLSRNKINFLNLKHNNWSPTNQFDFTMLAQQEFFCPIFLEESAEVYPLIT